MNQQSVQCIDQVLYRSLLPGNSFEEARAIVLGKYVEKELDSTLENKIREHLGRCNCCTQFLTDFESADLDISNAMVIEASCPSSAAVDTFLFNRAQLPANEVARIERHVQECDLCKEEVSWLKNLEAEKIIEFVPRNNDWVKILSVAAALFFVVLSAIFYVQKTSFRSTEQRLQSIAKVKEPDQINYAALRSSSIALPAEIDRIYEDGVNSLKQGRFLEAVRAMERVTDARPDHSGAIYLLGYSYYQLHDMDKAFALCDRAEQMHPHNIERCLFLVNIALKTGHYGRAIAEINGLHHGAPDQPEVKALYDQIMSITQGQTVKL